MVRVIVPPPVGKVGKVVSSWAKQRDFHKLEGCGCEELEKELDDAGPSTVRERLHYFAERLKETSKKYRKIVREKLREQRLKPPEQRDQSLKKPCIMPLIAYQEILLAACNQAEAELEANEVKPDESYTRVAQGGDAVTVCVTHYMRPQDLSRFIASVPQRYPLLVQDTGGNLSWGRNRLMERCTTPYALIVEEDMEFCGQTNVDALASVLEHDEEVVFAAGHVLDGRRVWRHNIEIRKGGGRPECHSYQAVGGFGLTPDGVSYQRCDLVKNFGLVRTEFARSNKWDEELPLSEHYDWFMRVWAKRPRASAYVADVGINHYCSRPSHAYWEARQRAWPLHKNVEDKHQMKILEPTPGH